MDKSVFKWNKTQNQLINSLGINKPFEIATAETCARYMNPYIPMKDGFLSQIYETCADGLGGYVKYMSPYAHKQYNGTDFNFSKEMHPLATHHWDKAMMLSKGTQLVSEISQLRKRFTT